MSIDPKLFLPKEAKAEDDADAEGEEDDAVPTAVPKSARRVPRGKGDERKKISHARKVGAQGTLRLIGQSQQKPEHIPRPRNAFILFRKHVVDSKLIPSSVEMRHQNVSIITAKMWAEADAKTKAKFTELAKKEKEEHSRKCVHLARQSLTRDTPGIAISLSTGGRT